MPDISNKEDIKIFVDAFYRKVRVDLLLGGVFAARIKDDEWGHHLERMYSFWNTVLFSQKEYRGNPFAKHADLPLQSQHFERWIDLFHQTIDEYFEGGKADEAKSRAKSIGAIFQAKLEFLRR